MANFETGLQRLAQHFATIMAERQPDVKIVWANGRGPAAPLDGRIEEWVRFTFRPIEDRAAAIGGFLYRGIGMVDVQVFTPLGKGEGTATQIERSVQEAMREPIAGIVVGPATFGTPGATEGYYQSQIRFRVTIDEAPA